LFLILLLWNSFVVLLSVTLSKIRISVGPTPPEVVGDERTDWGVSKVTLGQESLKMNPYDPFEVFIIGADERMC